MNLNPVGCGGGTGRWDLGSGSPPAISAIPECFCDTMLINGAPKTAEYVWHCHILEHEEHDMMHALVIV
jgi:hypothetical protein